MAHNPSTFLGYWALRLAVIWSVSWPHRASNSREISSPVGSMFDLFALPGVTRWFCAVF